ncbi:helix-turn-helix domain-containing protein [Rhizobium phaseoli]
MPRQATGLSRSTVSAQLKDLERRLGFDLVCRQRGRIALTGAGAIL